MLVCLLCTAHSFVSLSDLHTRKMETSSGGGAEQEVETKEAQGEFCLGSLGMERARGSSTQLVQVMRGSIYTSSFLNLKLERKKVVLWVLELMLLPMHGIYGGHPGGCQSSQITFRGYSIRGASEPHFKFSLETSLAVQCYHCREQGSIPGLETKILHPTWHTQKQEKMKIVNKIKVFTQHFNLQENHMPNLSSHPFSPLSVSSKCWNVLYSVQT